MSKRTEALQTILDNGYYLVPIAKGQKQPTMRDWPKLRERSAEYFARFTGGFGLITGVEEQPVCGVDIDSLDLALAEGFRDWCLKEIGPAPIRIGRAPKNLLLYATDVPYRKMSSKKFVAGELKHQLELLGTGQQFVAYGKHPDTGSPYHWVDSKGPKSTPASELTVITADDMARMVQAFEDMASALGYEPKSKGVQGGRAVQSVEVPEGMDAESVNALLSYNPKAGVSAEDCAKVIAALDAEDYDLWLKVGMALHHEFSGEDEGFGIWNDWSATATNYKGSDDLRLRWRGFTNEGANIITMRGIMREAEEINKQSLIIRKRDITSDMRRVAYACQDRFDLMEDVASQLGALTLGDPLLLLEAEKLIRDRYKSLDGGALPPKEARRALKKGLKDVASADDEKGKRNLAKMRSRYPWVSGWVYVAEQNNFVNTDTGVKLKPEGFRGMYESELSGEDGVGAANFVLDNNLIPKAERHMYLPGAGRLFTIAGVRYVNTYCRSNGWNPEEEALNIVEDGTGGGPRAEVFKRHLELLIGGGKWVREAQLFANFLRYIVERPGNKATWGVLMQGDYGDGKSEPVMRLMGKLLGHTNVTAIQGQTIEGSIYTSWAEGHCFAIIEEIKLHGHNRYDIMNRLKTPITNDIIEIHAKGLSPYTVKNTGNYYITTNYTDAIPLAKQDRRYMILFSRFPKRYRDDDKYFDTLFNVINSDEGAKDIGRWLLSVPYHPDFKPKGHAPHTPDKDLLVDLSRDDNAENIEDILMADDNPYFGKDYVIFGPFQKYVNNYAGEVSLRLLNKYLQELGYRCLGRYRIDIGQHRLWVRDDSMGLSEVLEAYELNKLLS